MDGSIFIQIGILLGLSVIGGALAQLLRQPLIVAFIAVGILVGPSALRAWNWLPIAARSSCSLVSASPCCCSSSASSWTCISFEPSGR